MFYNCSTLAELVGRDKCLQSLIFTLFKVVHSLNLVVKLLVDFGNLLRNLSQKWHHSKKWCHDLQPRGYYFKHLYFLLIMYVMLIIKR